MAGRKASFVLACLLWGASADFADFDEMSEINEWVAQATHAAEALGNQLSAEIPYIIVAGDQGVGKSTTINRLVNAELFPMRTAEQAATDAPMTKVATLYQVVKDNSGDDKHAEVKTTCTGTVCKKKGCEMQKVKKDELQETINKMQDGCFGGKYFGAKDVITVKYAIPDAVEVSIVDLPGIQQAGKEKKDSKALTVEWLKKRPNSIILAVMLADKGFQADIFGMLEEKVSDYRGRVIFAITKPVAVGEKNMKIVNTIQDKRMKQFDADGFALLSADTADADVDLSMDSQKEQETKYFENDHRYKDAPNMWGIDKLTRITQSRYLQLACASIPRIQEQLRKEFKTVTTRLSEMPKQTNVEFLIPEVVASWQKKIREDVYFGKAAVDLRKIYTDFQKTAKVRANEKFEQSIVIGAQKGLECDSPYMNNWFETFDNDLQAKVTKVMQDVLAKGLQSAISEILQKSDSLNLQALNIVKTAGLCDHDEVEKLARNVLCSFRLKVGDPLEKGDVNKYLDHLSAKIFPTALNRIVVQTCVMEPIDNLQKNIEQDKHLKSTLASLFNVKEMNEMREQLKHKADTIAVLMDKHLDCKIEV